MVRGKCTVCGSPNATNYHFGAQSCKACAAFFRRSIAMCQSYDCLGDRQQLCRIDHTLRLNCRSCRLTKCLQAGMHKDLVQAKREVKFELQSRSAIKVRQDDLGIYQPGTSSANDYTPKFSEMFYLSSENEWTHSPTKKRPLKSTTDIMGIEELQQFIKIPCDYTDNSEHSNKKINSMGLELFSLEEQERIYGVTALYTDLVIQLNSRRKITYTNNPLGTMFDEACVCPYRKTDLKLFHHRTYRSKNRNDYTMILDYVNRFPEFALLSKSEKTVLFRTAAAVDVLVDQAYYSESLFPHDDIMVTANGEYIEMETLAHSENTSELLESDEDYDKYRTLTQMKRRQWNSVVQPLKKLKMSLTEFALFKALTIWHYNYYKLQEGGRQICTRQRDDIFRSLLIICEDEGHDDAVLRASEIVLAVGVVLTELHEMVTSYIEITVLDVLDDPILKDMLKFQY